MREEDKEYLDDSLACNIMVFMADLQLYYVSNGSFDMLQLTNLVKFCSWSCFIAEVGASECLFSDWCINLVGCISS